MLKLLRMAIYVSVVLTIVFPDIVTRDYQADRQSTLNVKSGVINTMDAWPTPLTTTVIWLHVESRHAQVVTH